MRAFFLCPECGKPSKCAETIKRIGDDGRDWKYRRYYCSGGHSFSTAEQVYEAVRGRKPDLPQRRLDDDD